MEYFQNLASHGTAIYLAKLLCNLNDSDNDTIINIAKGLVNIIPTVTDLFFVIFKCSELSTIQFSALSKMSDWMCDRCKELVNVFLLKKKLTQRMQ